MHGLGTIERLNREIASQTPGQGYNKRTFGMRYGPAVHGL